MSPSRPKNSDDFTGVWTALATPFKADLEIDWDAFDKLIAAQEAAGVAGVVIAGTTGESPTLSVQEKLSLIRRARATLKPHVRVMAGSGDSNTRQSIELSRLSEDAGADSLLVVTPPYNKPSIAGLLNHYQSIAAAVKVPLCVYHVPGRTAQFLTVEQLAALCQVKGVGLVKEASADIAFFSRALMRGKIPFLSGDDPTYLASLSVGGTGVISVVSNIFPAAMVQLTDAFFRGDLARARALHQALLPAIDALFCEVNPCPTKAALAQAGLCQNTLRAPLAAVTPESYQFIGTTMASTRKQLESLQ